VNADGKIKFLNKNIKSSEVICKVIGQNNCYKIYNEANEFNVLAYGNYTVYKLVK